LNNRENNNFAEIGEHYCLASENRGKLNI